MSRRRVVPSLLLLVAATARAEDAPVVAPPLPSDAPAGEHLVVEGDQDRGQGVIVRQDSGTALFGGGDLHDVPFSLNVIGAGEIADRQARTIADVLRTDPAVTMGFGTGGVNISSSFLVRGFGTGSIIQDGVPLATWTIAGTEGLDSVEVLRGPAAFRYGFLAPGGAINLVSKRPTEEPSAALTLSADRFGTVGAHADAGGRALGKAVGYRINVAGYDGDTFVDDISQRRLGIDALVDWRVTDRLTLTAGFSGVRARTDGNATNAVNPDINGDDFSGLDPTDDFGQDWEYYEAERYSYRFVIDWRPTGHVSVTSATMYSDYDESFRMNEYVDNVQPNGDFDIYATPGWFGIEDWSNTTFITGRFATGAVTHVLTLGGSFARTDNLGGNPDGLYVTPLGTNNYYDPVEIAPGPTPGSRETYRTLTTQYAGFLSDQLDLTAGWRAVAGVRWSRITVEDWDLVADTKGPRSANSALSPMVGVMYDLTPDAMVYVSYGQGLERGGRAPDEATNAGEQMPALRSWQVEVGSKADLLDGRATLSGALFAITRDSEFTDSGGTYVQDGEQRHLGGEVMAKGRFWEPLELSAGAQYLHARLEETGDPATEGATPANVPTWQAVFSGDLHLWAVRGLYLPFLASYVGEREVRAPAIDATGDAYLRLDLGARYEFAIDGYEVIARVNVENLTDETYYVSADWNLQFGAPITTTGSLEVRF